MTFCANLNYPTNENARYGITDSYEMQHNEKKAWGKQQDIHFYGNSKTEKKKKNQVIQL